MAGFNVPGLEPLIREITTYTQQQRNPCKSRERANPLPLYGPCGEGKPEEAVRPLAKAVQLRPSVAEAHTALATNLFALHRTAHAEVQFRTAIELQPHSYDAEHNLGEFYIQTRQLKEAIPFLRRAQQIDPGAYKNGYDLALALEETGQYSEAAKAIE